MQPELFEHFAAYSHKGFENCSSLWVKCLKLMVTFACFFIHFSETGL